LDFGCRPIFVHIRSDCCIVRVTKVTNSVTSGFVTQARCKVLWYSDGKDAPESGLRLLKEEYPNYELEDVLDFFTTLDLLVEYNALDARLTYEVFTYWVTRYWCCAKEPAKSSSFHEYISV
jgi:hypothetical protein